MTKEIDIIRNEKTNGIKNYWVRLFRVEFDEYVLTGWGMVNFWYSIHFFWYNGKRQMVGSKSFYTIEEAQKWYNKKIKDLEIKIL